VTSVMREGVAACAVTAAADAIAPSAAHATRCRCWNRAAAAGFVFIRLTHVS